MIILLVYVVNWHRRFYKVPEHLTISKSVVRYGRFCHAYLGTYLEIKYVLFLFLARNYKQANGLAFRLLGGLMKLLEERILKDGHILGDNILKVDSFFNPPS